MNNGEHVFQPGREHLEKRKVEIEKLLKEGGRYELHRPGRKSIVLERDDLKKQLKEIKGMIKAQKKFDKKTDPAILQRKELRSQLIKLPKGNLVDLYLNLRFDKMLTQKIHLPIYKRGLQYEKEAMENGARGAQQKLTNNVAKLKADLAKHNITVTKNTKVASLRESVAIKNKTLNPKEYIYLSPNDTILRRWINEIKKG
jgi:copper chaperone CopZ